jgi:hypothetical protein
MSSTAKFALAAALVLAATFQASAATKARATQGGQAAAYDVIPGYGKDGGRVAVPNPNR